MSDETLGRSHPEAVARNPALDIGGGGAAFRGFSDQVVRRLTLLDSAETLGDVAALPSNRLEAHCEASRAGQQHSIRINVQWRICIRWG